MNENTHTVNCDFVLYHQLNNRPLGVREGDPIKIIKKEDIKSKVQFLDGEAKGSIFTIDNMLINFE